MREHAIGSQNDNYHERGMRRTFFERRDALERDAEPVRIEEARRVVQEFDILRTRQLARACWLRVLTRMETMDMAGGEHDASIYALHVTREALY